MYPGYATLETIDVTKDAKFPCYSQHVHGVLYRVSKDDMNKLITKEGGYVLKELEVCGCGSCNPVIIPS